MPDPKREQPRSGFTLIDLLAVIVTFVILAATLLPALASSHSNVSGLQCVSNMRQMTMGWRMYADNNPDGLVASLDENGSGYFNGRPRWTSGAMNYDGANPSNYDPKQNILKSPLINYVGKNVKIWKCPADTSTVSHVGQTVPRVKSISMNQVFDLGMWLPAPNWRTYAKMGEIVTPSKTWVFIDEHPDSLNDGAFAVQMTTAHSGGIFVDIPAWFHDGACGFGFADGHSELHKWTSPKSRIPVAKSSFNGPHPVVDEDAYWLSSVTTVGINGTFP